MLTAIDTIPDHDYTPDIDDLLDELEFMPLGTLLVASKTLQDKTFKRWFIRGADGHGAGSNHVAIVGTETWLSIAHIFDEYEVLYVPQDTQYEDYLLNG